jgi:hypothetical protein
MRMDAGLRMPLIGLRFSSRTLILIAFRSPSDMMKSRSVDVRIGIKQPSARAGIMTFGSSVAIRAWQQ